jgi:hypothetical protein
LSITKVIFLKGTGMVTEPYNAFGEPAESVSKVGELIEKGGGCNRRSGRTGNGPNAPIKCSSQGFLSNNKIAADWGERVALP